MVSGWSDVCRGSRLRFWITGLGRRRGVTSPTKGRSTCLPALMRVSVRNWDVNGGDNDPAWPRSPPTPPSSPQAAATNRLSRAAVLSAKQTRRKRRALLHAELTGPQACYYGEMVEDDYRSLECSWQGSWPALLHHRFTFLVKRSPSRLRSHWRCSQLLARLRMEVQREKKKEGEGIDKMKTFLSEWNAFLSGVGRFFGDGASNAASFEVLLLSP